MAARGEQNSDGTRTLGLLSVVAPVYDEEGGLEAFYARVCAALRGFPFELVLVDDGSRDSSPEILERLAESDPRVCVVFLSRNFGHQTALTAGLDHARGDAVVMIDADLQDPPELIPEMIDYWRRGCDVVYAVRRERAGESAFKLKTAKWFYSLFGALAQVELQHNSGDFRLLDRGALDALKSMRERHRFLRGMTVWVGFTQAAVAYERDARYAGKTKYTLPRMIRFSLDAIFSFSHRPLQLATLMGFIFSALAFIAIPVVFILRLLNSYIPGFATITIVILLLGGIQLIAVGIMGEYVGRIYDEVKGRPLYLVRARRNLLPDGVHGRRASRHRGGVTVSEGERAAREPLRGAPTANPSAPAANPSAPAANPSAPAANPSAPAATPSEAGNPGGTPADQPRQA